METKPVKNYWLKDDEKNKKLLGKLWPVAERAEILAAFPGKSWRAIATAANRFGFVRRRADEWNDGQLDLIREYFAKSHDETLSESEKGRLKLELIAKTNDISAKENLNFRKWEAILSQATRMNLKWTGKDSLEAKFIIWIKERNRAIRDVSNFLDRSDKNCIKFIDSLRAKGFPIEFDAQTRSVSWQENVLRDGSTDLSRLTRNTFKVLVLSDILIGHKMQQLTLLHTLYHLADIGYKDEEKGLDFSEIDVIFVLGNLFAGLEKKKGESKIFLDGEDPFTTQVNYVSKHFPRLNREVKTYILSGPNEIDLNKPFGRGKDKIEARNALQALCQDRSDLVYTGDFSHTFKVTGTNVGIHAAHTTKRGQSTYTKSLPLDRIEDSFNDLSLRRRGKNKPAIILIGGHHVPIYSPPITQSAEEHAIMVPSFCDPIASDRDREKQGSTPIIGFTTATITFDDKKENIVKVSQTHHSWTNHQIDKDYLAVPIYDDEYDGEKLTEDERSVLRWMQEEDGITTGETSRRLDRPKEKIAKILEGLSRVGVRWDDAKKKYSIEREQKSSFSHLPDIKGFVDEVYNQSVRRVVYSDTHFGSTEEQPHVLDVVAEVIKDKKVTVVYHCGDILDGVMLYGKKHMVNLYLFSAREQRERAIKLLPKIPGVQTFMISGSHDQVFNTNSGDDPIVFLAEHRPDLTYLGPDRGIVTDKETGITHMLLHPSGGVPKGRSYRPQEIVRMISESIKLLGSDVQGLFIGHLHIALFMRWRGIDAFLVPCAQKQTEYLVKKTLFPRLGCWSIIQTVDKDKDPTLIVVEFHAVDPKNYKIITELVQID
jgi:hypothetical protein